MTMVEKIGRFIIEYQFEVEMVLGLLVALIAMVLIIKAIRHARKKRELLSQINDTVSEINAAVNGMGTKKSDVIYIDNRSSNGEAKVEIPPLVDEVINIEQTFEETETKTEIATETDEGISNNVNIDGEEKKTDESEGRVKYFNRDCGMDKQGKIYTIEELKEQIKE